MGFNLRLVGMTVVIIAKLVVAMNIVLAAAISHHNCVLCMNTAHQHACT